MKRIANVIGASLFFVLVGCSSMAVTTVTLTNEERGAAQAIAERRQQIQFERVQVNNEFQQKVNHLNEQENSLNLESSKLCFAFKKAHKLEPNKNYVLDEWNGQLIKQ